MKQYNKRIELKNIKTRFKISLINKAETQESVNKHINKTNNFLTKFFAGEARLSKEEAQKICKYLDVDLEDLFGETFIKNEWR